MPTPIRRISTVQFALLALPAQLTRKISSVHLHHTRRPRRQDFRGLHTIDAVRRFHMETQGWGDIAQHLTIDPQGGLWTGRNWNLAPASAIGHNGSSTDGPFMIELIGDFDHGQDPFDGEQRAAAIAVVAHVVRAWGLKDGALKLHNQLTRHTSCPGTAIDRAAFLQAVRAVAQPKARTAGPFRREHLLGADSVRSGVAGDDAAASAVPENEAAGAVIDDLARTSAGHAQRRARGLSPRVLGVATFNASRGGDWSILKPHVINLAKGELSQGGEFSTNAGDVEAIVDAIRDYAAGTDAPRLMIHAHGGLVGETSALDYSRTMRKWWLDHGVYPVFFIWETSLLEIIGQFVLGRRDVADWTSDLVIEGLVKAPGSAAWAGMRESARLSSATDTGDGVMGGARLFARKLAALLNTAGGPAIPVHTVGHSAGAIFHAHLISALLAEGLQEVEHLYLLAPAARTELFRDQLAQPVAQNKIKALSVFTMEEEAEEQDDCFKLYRKSLLYLVSHACEGLKRRPILGLQKSLRKDDDLRALFGLDEDGVPDGRAAAKLILSYARGKPENPLTRALAHGAFDNDPKTMSSVLRRIIGVDDNTGIGEVDFPYPPQPRAFDFAVPAATYLPAATSPGGPAAGATASWAGASRIKALCIGIDKYRERPLAGCVHDARTWGQALAQLGARVDYLLDQDATCDGMKAALRALVASGAPGDVLVLQYSGHGGQLPSRVDSEGDGFNEALIPVDYDTGALLVDDEVAGILGGLAAGVAMTLFMDCCHSGTNSRFAPITRARAAVGDRPRFMPLSDDVVEAYFARRGTRASRRTADISLPGVVHFAACQDHELAWESNGQGDFTGAAARVLAAGMQQRVMNEQFAADVAAGLAIKGRQHPQLMDLDPAMRNRALLGAPGPAAVGGQ